MISKLTCTTLLVAILVGSGALPARTSSLFGAYDCFTQGILDSSGANPVITCVPTAPCPVTDGNCVKHTWHNDTDGKDYHYCDCANRPTGNPRDISECGIIGKFSGSTFIDKGCAITTCAGGCNCSVYSVGTLKEDCHCE